ncbi:MAG: hypothetical protein ACLFRP_01650 [Puniceicoccaceae bacterium]
MQYSILPRLCGCFSLCLAAALPLDARIGESRSDVESRLIRESGRGLEISDGDLEAFYLARSPVSGPVSALEGENVQTVLYYKTNDDLRPSSADLWQRDKNGRRSSNPDPKPDGWILEVVYLNGVSVLELYQRSKPLTDFEIKGLLAANQGRAEWVEGAPPEEDEEVLAPQVFPVNHYRRDLGVYANVSGNSVLLYDPRLDALIDEKQTESAAEKAPASLDGF